MWAIFLAILFPRTIRNIVSTLGLVILLGGLYMCSREQNWVAAHCDSDGNCRDDAAPSDRASDVGHPNGIAAGESWFDACVRLQSEGLPAERAKAVCEQSIRESR